MDLFALVLVAVIIFWIVSIYKPECTTDCGEPRNKTKPQSSATYSNTTLEKGESLQAIGLARNIQSEEHLNDTIRAKNVRNSALKKENKALKELLHELDENIAELNCDIEILNKTITQLQNKVNNSDSPNGLKIT